MKLGAFFVSLLVLGVSLAGCQDPNMPDSYTRAAWENDPAMARELMEKGVPVEKGDDQTHPPLLHALHQGYWEIAEILVEAGADVNEKTSEGPTIVEVLETEGKDQAVKWLRDRGAR